ncbi:MAG: amino acid permease [Candidatus Aureabacteria bacterium]|nr:amino acid permease [Candidatus Auribacterota bacterium]
MTDHVKLKKDLSWWDCSGIIVGIILGTGIFSAFPGLIAKYNTSTFIILLAWVAGGIFAWFGAMCYAELSSLFPHAGGDYTFLHKAYSLKGENVVSFLFGWSQIFVIRPASIVILALIFGRELQNILPAQMVSAMWFPSFFFALALLAGVTFINILGISAGKFTQNTITIIKILIIVFLIVYGLIKAQGVETNFAPMFLPEGKTFWQMIPGFFSAIVLVMWVYGGWNEAAYIAEEVKNPHHDIPKALFMGIFGVAILYIGLNYIFLLHFSPSGLANTYTPSSDLMSAWFSSRGRVIMSSIVMISAAGAVNGLVMTGGRMSYGIAKHSPSLKYFSKLHPKFKTPVKPLLANFLITAVVLISSRGDISSIENLTFYTAGVYWYFFALVVISLIIFRVKIKEADIPFKVPLYPFAPIVFLFVSGVLIWGAFDYKPFETLIGISILTIGIPIYYLINFNKPDNTLHLGPKDDRRINTDDRRQNKEERRKSDLGRQSSEEI